MHPTKEVKCIKNKVYVHTLKYFGCNKINQCILANILYTIQATDITTTLFAFLKSETTLFKITTPYGNITTLVFLGTNCTNNCIFSVLILIHPCDAGVPNFICSFKSKVVASGAK